MKHSLEESEEQAPTVVIEPVETSPIVHPKQGLPQWLQNPTTVSAVIAPTDELLIQNAQLDPKLLKNLSKQISHYFPIQKHLLDCFKTEKCDICVSASTGSGKTLAYCLPILDKLWNRVVRRVRCLIVVPTHELTLQVKLQIDDLTKGRLSTTALGNNSLAHERNGLDVDIIITTPGRLLDHMNFKKDLLLHLEYLVIDEADRLMNQHYQGWLQKVLEGIIDPKPKLSSTMAATTMYRKRVRKLLFSATLTNNPQKIDALKLVNPLLITLSEQKYSLPLKLVEKYVVSAKEVKPLVLLSMLKPKSLVFVKSVIGSQRLFTLVKKALSDTESGCITSSMSMKERKLVIQQFQQGIIQVLFCSDILSRGIDLGEARFVFNYDIPSTLVTYIHRVGRTARAGNEGTAISLVEAGQLKWFKSDIQKPLIREIGEIKVKEEEMAKFETKYKKGLRELKKVYGHGQVDKEESDEEIIAVSGSPSSSGSSTSTESDDSLDEETSMKVDKVQSFDTDLNFDVEMKKVSKASTSSSSSTSSLSSSTTSASSSSSSSSTTSSSSISSLSSTNSDSDSDL